MIVSSYGRLNVKRFSLPFIISCIGVTAGAQPVTIHRSLPAVSHRFLVVAHRGDHTEAPENTLASFANAIRDGADYVEIDLRTSADSQLLIMHDATVDRMTAGNGFVKDLSISDLKALKVKDRTHPEWGEFDIPDFAQVLELCKGKINIYLDFKNADPASAYKEIRRYGMEKQVVVYINAQSQISGWHRAAPAIPLMVSLPKGINNDSGLVNFLQTTRVEILDGNFDQYTEEMVRKATDMGLLVLPDIQGPHENADLWDQAIQKGIRGLQTDHPRDLIEYLVKAHLR